MRSMTSLLAAGQGQKGEKSIGLNSLGSDRGPGPRFPSAIRTVRPNAGNGPPPQLQIVKPGAELLPADFHADKVYLELRELLAK